ncbi:TetR family transcriptional regulator [bacterium]|nr:TetR family transcriptional regulator [bacterium]
MRRVPNQDRSRQRVAAILAATVKLVEEQGYEATTTAMIAQEAGVPIGTLYQFFANKEAILEALAQQYAADMLALRSTLFPEDVAQIPLPLLVDRTADKLVTFVTQHRGFNHLFGSAWGSPEIAAATEHMKRDMVEGITHLILNKAPWLSPAEAAIRARTLLHLIQGMLSMVEASNNEEYSAVMQEFKRAWLAYLTAAIQKDPETNGPRIDPAFLL